MPNTIRRLAPAGWYTRIPCDPPPGDLAKRLADANVASRALKRMDTYERYASQHHEHRRQIIRGLLGGAGLVLSIIPSVPTLVSSCRAERDLECGLRVSAMTGGAIALSVTAWAFWELWHQPSRMEEHVARLNSEMNHAQRAKGGDVGVEALFDLYQSMSRSERAELKHRLHELAHPPATA